jgi:hypothetical protein
MIVLSLLCQTEENTGAKLVRVGEAYPDIIAVDENGRQSRIEVEFEIPSFKNEITIYLRQIVGWHSVFPRSVAFPRFQKLAELSRFNQFLPPGDRVVFDDLLNQCKLYAPQTEVLASAVAELPLLVSMVFAQHKRLTELERRLSELLTRVSRA